MAHKKAILTKFMSDPEDTEGYQSPTFDGRTWTVPETASSDQESGQISDQQLPPNRENTQNQDLEPKPSTSDQQNNIPESSTSKSPIFHTDNSSVSPDEQSKQISRPRTIFIHTSFNKTTSSTSSGKTIPILGTSIHPIDADSTSDSPLNLSTRDSDKTTEVNVTSGTISPQLNDTIILTSTPVKSDAPPVNFHRMETTSGDTFSLPSEIFGSPPTSDQSPPPPLPQKIQQTSSDSSEEERNRQLDENLKRIKASIAKAQQRRKRKFFQTMLEG